VNYESAPFEPNISKIANRLHLGRNTVKSYLKNLRDARILHLIFKPGKGISALQKPDKIYFENTSFVYTFQTNANIGRVRETVFLNQISNSGPSGPYRGKVKCNSYYSQDLSGQGKWGN